MAKGAANGGWKETRVEETPVTLSEFGIDKNLANRARKYAAIPEQEFNSPLTDWRARAQGGVQRRLEARIGQLLGDPEPGKRNDMEPVSYKGQVSRNERMDFRILARASNGDVRIDQDVIVSPPNEPRILTRRYGTQSRSSGGSFR